MMSKPDKALSIKQPWADLILFRGKDIILYELGRDDGRERTIEITFVGESMK